MLYFSKILLLILGGVICFFSPSAMGFAMPAVRAGFFVARRLQAGCELPSIPYGTANGGSFRRMRKISVDTVIKVECNYRVQPEYEHIQNMKCRDRDGHWDFPDDSNFTLKMLANLCVVPKPVEINSEQYSFTQAHTDTIISSMPMVLSSAFILSLLVLAGMMFRSKLFNRHVPVHRSARNYILRAEEPTAVDNREERPSPNIPENTCCRNNFTNLSEQVDPPPTYSHVQAANVPPCHCHPSMKWHDTLCLNEARMYASYNAPGAESDLPSYEEAIKTCTKKAQDEKDD